MNQSATGTQRHRRAGFTLIELMAALSILGLALFVLLDAHYTTLMLHDQMTEEVTLRQLTQTVVAKAEVGVLTEALSESGDFGERYPDYSWSYDAALAGNDELILLYLVTATITGPTEDRTLEFYVYNTGLMEEAPSGGASRNRSRQRGGGMFDPGGASRRGGGSTGGGDDK